MSKKQRKFLIYTNPLFWLYQLFYIIPKNVYFWFSELPKYVIKLHYKKSWSIAESENILREYEEKFINGKEEKCDPISRYYWDKVYIRAQRIKKIKKKY